MEHCRQEDIEIIFDYAGRNDWGKYSFPVPYGITVKLKWQGYEFDFNLRGGLKRLTGNVSVWPDPRELLKRTDGNDFIYYGTDGYDSLYDLIKNYYFPFNGHSDCGLFPDVPLAGRHVREALRAFERLVLRAGEVAAQAPRGRAGDFLFRIAARGRAALAKEAERLHGIIGGGLPVLPPDTIDVDYEVIPLIVTEGCSYNCRFCSFKTAGGFSVRSRGNIAAQIEGLKEFYGPDLVNYNSLALGQNNALAAGADILIDTAQRAYEVLNMQSSYHQGPPNLFIFGSADTFLEKRASLLDRLEGLPFRTWLNIGLESPHQETLNRLGKPLKTERVREAFSLLQEVNSHYSRITATCNFVLGRDLPEGHVAAVKALLAEGAVARGRGVVYLSPLLGASERRQILRDFREIKMSASLPVFIYLAQRL